VDKDDDLDKDLDADFEDPTENLDDDEEEVEKTIADLTFEDLFDNDDHLIFKLVAETKMVTGIILTHYTAATFTADEEALWLDRDGNGLIDFAEWLTFNAELNAWTQQLKMAGVGETVLVTADVVTNSDDMDSGFYQDGLPALIDADSNG
jgi:hypothetical protein